MENATKALLMAAGVLIAILIISMFVLVLRKTGNVSKTYDSTVSSEEVTIFNNNFTQYLGKKITIHEAITITNFARSNGVTVIGAKETKDIVNNSAKEKKYAISINNYDENGYINSITIN